MEKFANLISSYRWWFISFIVILTCFFAYNAKRDKTDNSIEIWLKQDDPALTFYNKFKEDFGNEEFLLITIDTENIFSTEGIRLINKISSEIKELKGISNVTSISTIFKQQINTPYFNELLTRNKSLKQDQRNQPNVNSLEIFKQDLLKDPLYVNNVISKDGKTKAIIAMVEGPVAKNRKSKESTIEQNWSEFRKELVRKVRKLLADCITSLQEVDADRSEQETSTQEKTISEWIINYWSNVVLAKIFHYSIVPSLHPPCRSISD